MGFIKCFMSGSKGGVGKSTLAILASHVAPLLNYRLGIIDLAMGNPTTTYALLGSAPKGTLAAYLSGVLDISNIIYRLSTKRGPIILIPSSRGDEALLGLLREDILDRFEELINNLPNLDGVVIDFPAFDPEVGGILSDIVRFCDDVYVLVIQDIGSIIASRRLVTRTSSVRAILNMYRETLGKDWVKAINRAVGDVEIIRYDPFLQGITLGHRLPITPGLVDATKVLTRVLG